MCHLLSEVEILTGKNDLGTKNKCVSLMSKVVDGIITFRDDQGHPHKRLKLNESLRRYFSGHLVHRVRASSQIE